MTAEGGPSGKSDVATGGGYDGPVTGKDGTPATDARPLIAITMGDPAGIGPEIVLRAFGDGGVSRAYRALVVGDTAILERAQEWVTESVTIERITDPRAVVAKPGVLPVMDLGMASREDCPPGVVRAAAGDAAVAYIRHACQLALAGDVAAMVTAPLNKESMNLAGHHYAGHTELLAELTAAEHVSMLLVSDTLRIVHVSTHVALSEALERVRARRVEKVISLAYESCRMLGITEPRIGVAGLNPHAGEGGLFGDQEQREIFPAIAAARQNGWQVSDPQPPDTVFLRATRGEFDIVVAMYHDQGHIPMKLLAFDSGVNVSVGLPIIRTSVDHGTAFDIAGTGTANPSSLLRAVEVACTMIAARSA